MTKPQLKQLVDDLAYPNYGLVLGYFIRRVLKNSPTITVLQDSAIESASNADGSYSPATFDSLYKSCLEVLGLVTQGKTDSVITLLKRCPVPEQERSNLIYFINGKRCSRGDYYNADQIAGKRTMKGVEISDELFSSLIEDIYRTTPFAGTRLGEQYGVANYGDHYAEITDFKKPITEPIIPEPKADEIDPPTIYKDIGDDEEDIGLTEEQEFHHNEEAEDWINRPNRSLKE